MTDTLAFATAETPLGPLLAAVTGDGVAWLDFRDGPDARARAVRALRLPVVADPARTAPVTAALAAYFAEEARDFDVPLDWRLYSPLQRQVLETLYTTVPYGALTTYGEIGTRSGAGVPAQAIGQVMGSNPIPLIVPCHRVVSSTGLGGYSGGSGVEVKRWLLMFEGALPATLDWDPAEGPRS
ncbi:methylated-DNA--[protein]-cysteine S-methyltransferase [Actinomadura sp. PM05-2]|uniref:Methylated-DNA--[protein]-cysteine S-methyltransferase n=2 Tax=Actinomadura parmotrematis TaxID=2864039 RepID=A0ABS7FQB2_9ACTN|nr:methylated-DNA--[protein]-cysteine S-methyltransferase [Actinomadura parmotrematis]